MQNIFNNCTIMQNKKDNAYGFSVFVCLNYNLIIIFFSLCFLEFDHHGKHDKNNDGIVHNHIQHVFIGI